MDVPTSDDPFAIEDELEAKANALGNAHRFDVHKWADHPEVNAFVNEIYATTFVGRASEITKKHLKVVLLDLYVTWTEDPSRYTALARSPNAYKAKTRYNELHISRTTIAVVDTLIAAGLVEQEIGFYDRENKIGRLTRVRPTVELTNKFADARFSQFDIGYHEDRLAVILRNKDPDEEGAKDVAYIATEETALMSAMLDRYNWYLRHTFIDIPSLEKGYIC